MGTSEGKNVAVLEGNVIHFHISVYVYTVTNTQNSAESGVQIPQKSASAKNMKSNGMMASREHQEPLNEKCCACAASRFAISLLVCFPGCMQLRQTAGRCLPVPALFVSVTFQAASLVLRIPYCLIHSLPGFGPCGFETELLSFFVPNIALVIVTATITTIVIGV